MIKLYDRNNNEFTIISTTKNDNPCIEIGITCYSVLVDNTFLKGFTIRDSKKSILTGFNDRIFVLNEKNKLIRLCFIEESSDFNNLEFYPPKTELEKMEFWAQKRAESERYISFIVINLEKLKKTKEEVDKTIKEKEEIMEREKGRPVKIFTNEVIPDRTAEIEKQMREEQIRQSVFF